MKKLVSLFCATAMLAALYSCCGSDNDNTPVVTPVTVDTSHKLVVTTNTSADISYAGKTISNTKRAVFTNTEGKGVLHITPLSTEYYGQSDMDIDFYDKLTLAVSVQLVKKPTILVSQEEAKNGTVVTNDTENQVETETVASISVPSTTVITGNTTDPFSITTFVPAETVLESTEKGEELEANVLVIRCTPDGASFSVPVVCTLAIANSSGFEIESVYADDDTEVLPMTDLGNNKWSISIPHFSDWFVMLRATVAGIVDGEEALTGSSAIVPGNNSISYQVKAGAVETTSLKCPLISAFIQKEFGVYYTDTKTATFSSDVAGTAYWRTTQPYRDITLTSGIMEFKVRVYGEPTFVIERTEGIGEGGHSGGSAS